MYFIRFCLVGTAVFVFEAALLTALYAWVGLNAAQARLISFPCAVVLAWYLNRRFTFRSANALRVDELGRYALNNLGGLLLNAGVYFALLTFWPPLRSLPIVALGAGAVAGLAFNYLGSRHWVFRRQT